MSVVYVSPLKALNNDVQRNLLEPLAELGNRFSAIGADAPEIRVLTRSGDTPQSHRQAMIRKPPEILITTPESLNLILNSPRAREMLRTTKTVVLDEVHALAGNRRGVHLMSAVERITLLAGEFQRISMSATVSPMHRVARFIGGFSQPDVPRSVETVSVPGKKRLALAIDAPLEAEGEPDRDRMWGELIEMLRTIISGNRSTIVFCTNRRDAEKITLLLNEGRETETAFAHHGSLAREVREEVEQRMKAGLLPAIVATTSLELGIDVGSIDEVVFVRCPYSVASTVQMIGRSGHRVGLESRATFLSIHPRDLVDTAVACRSARRGRIEELRPLRAPLDVLCQIVLGMVCLDSWRLDDLYAFLRRIEAYSTLSRAAFDGVVDMLVGRYADSRVRELVPRVLLENDNTTIRGKEGSLRLLYHSGGTIPDRGYYALKVTGSGAKVGELDEEFVWERRQGEVFVFGTQVWRIVSIDSQSVEVAPAGKRPSLIPFWRGEQVSRSPGFSRDIMSFLGEADRLLETAGEPELSSVLERDYAMSPKAAGSLVSYLDRQRAHTGRSLPHDGHVLVEQVMQSARAEMGPSFVIHSLWGLGVNLPLGLSLARFYEQELGIRAEVSSDNNALLFQLSEEGPPPDGRLLGRLARFADPFESLLREGLEETNFFAARFREAAARSLLLPRKGFDRRMPLWMTRERAKRLLRSVRDYSDFPILLETWRTCLQEDFDLDALRELLERISADPGIVDFCRTANPSPFAANLVWQDTNVLMYETDAERQLGASGLSTEALSAVLTAEGSPPSIDPELIAFLEARLKRTAADYAPKSVDELLSHLTERQCIPDDDWQMLLKNLEAELGVPAAKALPETEVSHVRGPSESSVLWCRSSDDALLQAGLQQLAAGDTDGDAAIRLVRAILEFCGPREPSELAAELGVPSESVGELCSALVDSGRLVRGKLRSDRETEQLCDADNYERLLRLQRSERRWNRKPRDLSEWVGFMRAYHQLEEGLSLEDALDRLFAYPAPAETFESELLANRVAGYRSMLLDGLFEEVDLRLYGRGGAKVFIAAPDELTEIIGGAPAKSEESESRLSESIVGSLRSGPVGVDELSSVSGLSARSVEQELWKDFFAGLACLDNPKSLRAAAGMGFRFSRQSGAAGEARRSPGRRGRYRPRPRIPGRWELVRSKPPESRLEQLERARHSARVLLDRYGVVFRELCDGELFRWSDVFPALRLMELGGEVIAGRFFSGLDGLEFARPGLIEEFGAFFGREAAEKQGDLSVLWTVSMTDPCAPGLLPRERLGYAVPARRSGNYMVFRNSQVALTATRSGRDLTVPPGAESYLSEALDCFSRFMARAGKNLLYVESVNGVPTRESALRDVFVSLGFRADYKAYLRDLLDSRFRSRL